jgi:hypothetical protein
MRGFICNDNATTEIVATYGNGVLLHEDASVDARSRAMPQSCWLSHVDISLTNATSAATVSAFLTGIAARTSDDRRGTGYSSSGLNINLSM